jgi:hypothetical protein
LIAVLAALAAWRYVARRYLDIEDLTAYAACSVIRHSRPSWFRRSSVVGGLLMVPVMLLIAVALVFGPFPGILYAFAGALASAAVTWIGKAAGSPCRAASLPAGA